MDYMLNEKLIWRTFMLTMEDAAMKAGLDRIPADEARYHQLEDYARIEFFFPTEAEIAEQEAWEAGPGAEEIDEIFDAAERRKLAQEKDQLEKIFDPEAYARKKAEEQVEKDRQFLEDTMGDYPF